MTGKKAKGKGAPPGASKLEPTGIDEIRAMYRARVYADIEPLLQCLEKHGLDQPEARAFVANLARKADPPRPQANEALELRDFKLAALVAYHRGLRKRSSEDPRRAIGDVVAALEKTWHPQDRKKVERAWKGQLALLGQAPFEPYFRAGMDGAKFPGETWT